MEWVGKSPRNGFLYDRVSSAASALDTKENLSPYHQAQAVLGVVTEPLPSLVWQFRALASEHRDPWSGAKAEVKELLRAARKLGGEDAKAGIGTAVHRFTMLVDQGVVPEFSVPELAPWLDCYSQAMARFEVLEQERFIVTDDVDGGDADLRVAGSYDRLVRDRVTGEVMIADVKTGRSDPDFAMSVTVQVAMYAHGVHYDQQSGRREPIHPEVSRSAGLLIHLPVNGDGPPRCTVYRLDVGAGWELAKVARMVADARSMKATAKDVVVSAESGGSGG